MKEINCQSTAEEYWNKIESFLRESKFFDAYCIKPRFANWIRLKKVDHLTEKIDIQDLIPLENNVHEEISRIIDRNQISISSKIIPYKKSNKAHSYRLHTLFMLWFCLYTGCRVREAMHHLNDQKMLINEYPEQLRVKGYSVVWEIELKAKYTKTYQKNNNRDYKWFLGEQATNFVAYYNAYMQNNSNVGNLGESSWNKKITDLI